jgi:RNA ligase
MTTGTESGESMTAQTGAQGITLGTLLDEAALAQAIGEGFVREQIHPELPLKIFNYTQKAQYEAAWNTITRTCRGLIVDALTGEIVARPWSKFHNYGEHPEGSLDLLSPAEVTDKKDGSLGIMYPAGGRWAIATRGSFASEQAIHATRVLRERYPDFVSPDGMTVLFEIVYPANRIVVDYGATDDLILLGAVDIATGEAVGPDWISLWDGPVTETMTARTLAEALSLPPRPGCEGIVVRLPGSVMIKLKQSDYLVLHRILTTTTARTVWEFLAVNACKHLIANPKHWGSRLGIDPVRAAEILEVGDDWLSRLLDGVPDEFHAWLRATMDGLNGSASDLYAQLTANAEQLRGEHGTDRKSLALAVGQREHSGAIYLLVDGRDITTYTWKAVYPEPGRPFAEHGEDVA